MPYDLTGYDSAGVQHAYVMDDMGAVTGDDDLLPGWLGANPYEKPEPAEGETAPESGALTPSQVEAMRQHASKILTYVQIVVQPEVPEIEPQRDERGRQVTRPSVPESPHSSVAPGHRRTHAELEAMTVTDLRSFAHSQQIAGASSMSKAELIAALSAPRP
jgi:hypothetical protein